MHLTDAAALMAYVVALELVGAALIAIAGPIYYRHAHRGNHTPPPPLAGLTHLGPRHALRVQRWSVRGFAYGARHGQNTAERAAAALLTSALIAFPLSVAAQSALMRRPNSRYYSNGHAVIGITRHRDHWSIEDFVSARPGTKTAPALSDAVRNAYDDIPSHERVPIHATAASARLVPLLAQSAAVLRRRPRLPARSHPVLPLPQPSRPPLPQLAATPRRTPCPASSTKTPAVS